MAFEGKSLNDGSVPASWGTLYACPTGKKAILRTINFINKTGVVQTLETRLFRNLGGVALGPRAVLAQNEFALILTDGEVLVMSADDILEGQTTSTISVDFYITGAEE